MWYFLTPLMRLLRVRSDPHLHSCRLDFPPVCVHCPHCMGPIMFMGSKCTSCPASTSPTEVQLPDSVTAYAEKLGSHPVRGCCPQPVRCCVIGPVPTQLAAASTMRPSQALFPWQRGLPETWPCPQQFGGAAHKEDCADEYVLTAHESCHSSS